IISTLTISTIAQSKPRSLILPLTKDRATNQILTRLEIGTPRVSRNFIVDIAARQLWLDCYSGYSNSSSTYRLARCGSAACSVGKADCPGPCLLPPRPGCFNNTCVVLTRNPIRTTAGSWDEGRGRKSGVRVGKMRKSSATAAGVGGVSGLGNPRPLP
ncbi:unnamed protein product, partial [Linum tenue]